MSNEPRTNIILEWWDGEKEWSTVEGADLPDTIKHRGAKFFRKPYLKSKKRATPRYQTMSTKPKD